MTSDNREEFLNFIAAKAERPRHQLADHPFVPLNDLPETTLADKTPAELFTLAKENSEAEHVTFKTAATTDLPGVLDQLITDKTAQSLLLPTDERIAAYGLTDWAAQVAPRPTYWDPAGSRTENIQRAQDADLAIGCVEFLCAESGTITVATTPGQGRSFHFLPKHYVALVPQSRIVPRSRQAMDWYDTELKAGRLHTSNINFITGPSNSGDIEMVLVVGVHGPIDMTYVVLTDK
jgi:L-lactate dehydrogenase complex protein LldG